MFLSKKYDIIIREKRGAEERVFFIDPLFSSAPALGLQNVPVTILPENFEPVILKYKDYILSPDFERDAREILRECRACLLGCGRNRYSDKAPCGSTDTFLYCDPITICGEEGVVNPAVKIPIAKPCIIACTTCLFDPHIQGNASVPLNADIWSKTRDICDKEPVCSVEFCGKEPNTELPGIIDFIRNYPFDRPIRKPIVWISNPAIDLRIYDILDTFVDVYVVDCKSDSFIFSFPIDWKEYVRVCVRAIERVSENRKVIVRILALPGCFNKIKDLVNALLFLKDRIFISVIRYIKPPWKDLKKPYDKSISEKEITKIEEYIKEKGFLLATEPENVYIFWRDILNQRGGK